MTHIAVINESTLLSTQEVEKAAAAVQKQVSEHFAAAYGVDATLDVLGAGARPPSGAWQMAILDDSDQADALGYHDLTNEGLPLGKVFVRADLQAGASWSVTLSHETLEMLADPDIDLTVLVDQNGRRGWLFAYEVSDACEADSFGYLIDGVRVSDFVYPSWFETFWTRGGTRFDQTGHIQEPLELLPGGYISVLRLLYPWGWQEVTARGEIYQRRPPVGSRRERRRLTREHWKKSELKSGSQGS